MLVLLRKTNQSIHIGDVVISVAQIKGNKVRLAIDAPSDVRVLRGELKQLDGEAIEDAVENAVENAGSTRQARQRSELKSFSR